MVISLVREIVALWHRSQEIPHPDLRLGSDGSRCRGNVPLYIVYLVYNIYLILKNKIIIIIFI